MKKQYILKNDSGVLISIMDSKKEQPEPWVENDQEGLSLGMIYNPETGLFEDE